jgi:hypothetical protein
VRVSVLLYLCVSIYVQYSDDASTVNYSIILGECYVTVVQNNFLLSLPRFDKNKLFCIKKNAQ